MQARDADREALVEELVGHHEPVDDATRDRGEAGRQHEPEREERELEPDDATGQPPRGLPAALVRRSLHPPTSVAGGLDAVAPLG